MGDRLTLVPQPTTELGPDSTEGPGPVTGPAHPTHRPHFDSRLRASALRDTARARWVAEQHFVYERSNDPDVILLSMKSTSPLGTAVLIPDASGSPEVIRCRTVEEQTEFYRSSRQVVNVADPQIFDTIGSDWYALVTGVLTSKELATGREIPTEVVAVLPVSPDEDTIIGEIGFGRAHGASDPAADLAWRTRALRSRQERLRALQARDTDGLAALYALDATIVAKAPGAAEQAVHTGRAQIAGHYAQLLDTLGSPAIELLSSRIDSWYSFTELIWESPTHCYRTADISVVDAHGLITRELGYAVG